MESGSSRSYETTNFSSHVEAITSRVMLIAFPRGSRTSRPMRCYYSPRILDNHPGPVDYLKVDSPLFLPPEILTR